MAKLAPITIPTEPIGSIPRPVDLIERVANADSEDPNLAPLYEDAIRDTIERFEATGSPVVTDGEQRKHHNFATYCVHGLPNTAPGFQNPVLRRTYAPDRWAMSVKFLLITTTGESHDVPLAGGWCWVQATASGDSFPAASGWTVAAACRRRTRWIPLMIV